jgi:predicted nucleotidyltransferase
MHTDAVGEPLGVEGPMRGFSATDRVWQDGHQHGQTIAPPLAEREGVIRTIREHEAGLRALGAARLWLFGSLERAEAGAAGDVDVMIGIPRGRKFSLFDLGEVRIELGELLDREVDVVIEEDLVPEFRSDIARDLVRVF